MDFNKVLDKYDKKHKAEIKNLTKRFTRRLNTYFKGRKIKYKSILAITWIDGPSRETTKKISTHQGIISKVGFRKWGDNNIFWFNTVEDGDYEIYARHVIEIGDKSK